MGSNMFGFRLKVSSVDCISTLVGDIYQSFQDKLFLNALFLDIKSAFNRVHIPTLKQILRELGIPEHFSIFILKLMSPRKLDFRTNSPQSISRTTYKGLPQGSSLTPTLFNLYNYVDINKN